eukprot:Blabericola_migrator_1__8050@NODE_4132_length_1317_cov_7_230400_g2557_i0_p1_GENE_NODE_4132_length_1317_cov_7_230400_g2557_i0NODE_4132_length_1317_cov_7_230400_g2557_i0_p1_ORF_typecomplete_len315_score19_11ABC_tran/PF00005_27/2_5e31AAA_21/PF13304_6/5_7e16SMC_N/PF02463_19/0_8SMC_N/PF02463_19/0_00071AAA_15/PF13175_6/0_16AAA_15/PF13175_6/0_0088AAA_29/PF13555_6/0_00084MutS_V/PF00488_21/13MutS_V/PF00488_21/0_3DUF4162/PF13732_6/0_017MukB/PF04310_12/0_032AAA_5/PF07728_14/0_039ATPase/PF06745_13/0_11Zeta_
MTKAVHIVDHLSLTLGMGAFYGLLGPNGAGKSTLIGILTSLIPLQQGTVELVGFSLQHQRIEVKRRLGIVPQDFNFNPFELVENVLLHQAGFYGIPFSLAHRRVRQWLTEFDLWDKRKAAIRELSGGMKRRLLLARALIPQPSLLILDEPTAGMDLELRELVWEKLRLLNQAGTTIILTTHYLEEAETLCTQIGLLGGGLLSHTYTKDEILTSFKQRIYQLEAASPYPEVVSLDPHYQWTPIHPKVAEVTVSSETGLYRLFTELQEAGIVVESIAPKEGRLEAFFKQFHQVPSKLSESSVGGFPMSAADPSYHP